MTDIDEYDLKEAAVIKALRPHVVEAFTPVAFQKVKYPTRVTDTAGLRLYVDAMHEGTVRIWDNIGFVFDHELAAVKSVATRVGDLTGRLFGERVIPRDALLQSIIPWRAVRQLFPQGSRVHELGPGSGYLACLLHNSGYRYSGFEITQGFYLWQRELFEHFGIDGHRAWWIGRFIEDADVIVANHMLNEMHPHALKMLIEGCKVPLIVEGWGSECIRRKFDTRKTFIEAGWTHCAVNERVDVMFPTGPNRWPDMDKALNEAHG